MTKYFARVSDLEPMITIIVSVDKAVLTYKVCRSLYYCIVL